MCRLGQSSIPIKLDGTETPNGPHFVGDKKCKGIKKCVVKKTLTFEDYKNCLFEDSTEYRFQLMFQSIRHKSGKRRQKSSKKVVIKNVVVTWQKSGKKVVICARMPSTYSLEKIFALKFTTLTLNKNEHGAKFQNNFISMLMVVSFSSLYTC